MRIVFMGTPDIAKEALDVLLNSSGHEIVGVYTRPDKPVGRKQEMTAPPVKRCAIESQIPVFQPPTLRTEYAAADLAKLRPDLVVVVAYGMILPPAVLAVPVFGCVNMHVSLLPKYRGAAPIQWAVINGETQTGVTIMQLDEGMDTGAVLTQEMVQIPPLATAGEVFDLVSGVGALLLKNTLPDIFAKKIQPQPQQGEVSYAPMLKKEMAQMDFSKRAEQLHNLVRGCNPWPVAWFVSGGKRVKILRAHVGEMQGAAGEILSVSPLTVGCGGDTSLVFEMVHPEGSRAMTGEQWAAGRRFAVGQEMQEKA